jgi:hypothetical protein
MHKIWIQTVCFMIWSVSGVTEKKLMWIHYKMF